MRRIVIWATVGVASLIAAGLLLMLGVGGGSRPPGSLVALRPGVPGRVEVLAVRPGEVPGMVSLPAAAGAGALALPQAPLTSVPPDQVTPPLPAAGPVISPGNLGLHEEPSGERIPVLTVTNLDDDWFELTLDGPGQYRLVVGPLATEQVQVAAGTYSATLRSDVALPNSGWGVFREYRRYSGFVCSLPLGSAAPLRLGELEE